MSSSDASPTVMLVAGAVFFLPGAGLLVWGATFWSEYIETAGWEEIEGRVLEAKLVKTESHSTDRHSARTLYHLEARYIYSIGSRSFEGKRVDLSGGSSSDFGLHNKRLRELNNSKTSRKPIRVWVNPGDPTKSVLFRDADFFMYLIPGLGFLFALSGGGLLAGGTVSILRNRSRLVLAAQYPDTPWKRRSDWITFIARAQMPGLWSPLLGSIMTILGGGVFTAILLSISKVPWAAWLPVGICLIAGMLGFMYALFRIVQRLKYGIPTLQFSELPLIPGRPFEGLFREKRSLRKASELKLTLRCEKPNPNIRVNGVPVGEIIFEKVQIVTVQALQSESGSGASFAFELPDLPPRMDDDPEHGHRWTLLANVEAPLVGMQAKFDLPVYGVDSERVEQRPE